jgi:hypothetical protein
MAFLKKYNDIMSYVISEQDQPTPATAPQDATTPDPAAQPEPAADNEPQAVAPEGYVSVVKMLAKALVMDIPAGEIDAIFTGNAISKENAFDIQNKLKLVMNENEVKSDNIERLNNSNYQKFINSVNENNFMQRYNVIVDYMKKKSPYVQ